MRLLFASLLGGIIGGAAIAGGVLMLVWREIGDGSSQPVLERIIERETTVKEKEYIPQTTQEDRIIRTVKEASPAVVSIVITKDVPVIEQYFSSPFGESFPLEVPQYRQRGTERREVGGGTGFFAGPDGMIVTNKHVVLDKEADYTVFTNTGESYPAEVLARDPVQDIAVLRVEPRQVINENGEFVARDFPYLRLGDSGLLQIGQTVVAIGNALGEFRNTVSVGVISGLGRTVTASGGDFVETIENVIQTDAAINKGNSGGPLLNLAGEVVGVNTATVLGAQNIGFSIPADKVKRDIEQVRSQGKITYAFLGIQYVMLNERIQQESDLSVSEGAWITGEGEAVVPGSAADEAGLRRGDIIVEIDGTKVTQDTTLGSIIQKRSPGETVVMRVLREGEERILSAKLGEREG